MKSANLKSKNQKLINYINKKAKKITWNRRGPSLYFYQQTHKRKNNRNIKQLFNDDSYIELLYATLAAWDMNSRGAKMKDFNEFYTSLKTKIKEFEELEKIDTIEKNDWSKTKQVLRKIYNDLNIMESTSKTIAFSKVLHFLFPKIFMPMDRNTFYFFYDNFGVSFNKYCEILYNIQFLCMQHKDWAKYLDKEYNPTIIKLIDNAIHEISKNRTNETPTWY